MIYYYRIDVSEGIDVNKTSIYGHDLLMMSMNLGDITVLSIKSANYRCVISRIRKSEAINLLPNIDLTKKTEHYKT